MDHESFVVIDVQSLRNIGTMFQAIHSFPNLLEQTPSVANLSSFCSISPHTIDACDSLWRCCDLAWRNFHIAKTHFRSGFLQIFGTYSSNAPINKGGEREPQIHPSQCHLIISAILLLWCS